MPEQSFDLPQILRLSQELEDQVERGLPGGLEATQQRLIDSLNPSGAVFPGDDGAAVERERWRTGKPATRNASLGWVQVLSRSELSVRERNVLWSIAVGLADLRGGFSSGLSLLQAGTEELQELLLDSHLDCEVMKAHLLRVGNTGERMISDDWRTFVLHIDNNPPAPKDPDSYVIGTYRTQDGRLVPIHREDCVPSDAGVPTVCPGANPPPPITESELDDFLGWVEQRFREDGLLEGQKTIHWVGYGRACSRCFCPTVRPTGRSLPPEWGETRAVYRSANEALAFVRPHRGRSLTVSERAELDRIGVAASGLIRALGVLPHLPPGSVPYGALAVPVVIGPDGVTLAADEGRLWESRCEAARHDAANRLESLGRELLASSLPPFDMVPTIPAELRAIPDGTPEPLAEAYRTLVEAVAAATELYYEAPQPTFGLQQSLDLLAGRRKSLSDPDDGLDPLVSGAENVFQSATIARKAYTAVEATLVTHAGTGGCAFKAAFAVIQGVVEAAESVLGVVRSDAFHATTAEPTYRPTINPYQAGRVLVRCQPIHPAALLSPAREQLLRVREATCIVREQREAVRQAKPIQARGATRDIANGKMFTLMKNNETCLDWSARQWSEYLVCGTTTVKATTAWATIQMRRAAEKRKTEIGESRTDDRRKKKRHKSAD